MAKSRTQRRSKCKSRRGGAPVFVGSSWAPANSNMHRDLTAPSAIGNYFKPSLYGVPGGGFQPPVPEMNDLNQINKLPSLRGGLKRSNSKRSTYKRSGSKRSGSKRSGSKRGKRGGYSLAGFPQLAGTAWDSAIGGIKNVVNGFNGTSQLPSAWPYNQPELTKQPNIPFIKPIDITALKTAAAERAAAAAR